MPKRRRISLSDQKEMFDRNAKINIDTVAAHEKLERELRKLGVIIKPSFNLEPPLGRNRTGLRNRNG